MASRRRDVLKPAVFATKQRLVSDADHVELERLVTEAAWRVDEGKSDKLHELFKEDGELVIGESVLRVREAIHECGRQLEQARTYRCIRHVAGNMRFSLIDDGTVQGVTVLTVYMDDKASSSVPWVVGGDHD
jgi:hypothetical protein